MAASKALLVLAFGLLATPLAAQPNRSSNPPQPTATLPGVVQPHKVDLNCAPGATSKPCVARHAALQRVLTAPTTIVIKPQEYGVPAPRFVPPKIEAFLHDPRIDPQTRAFLEMVAIKPTKDWTLGELHMVEQIVPTLTELRISTATLSDFYQFLGLKPEELFEPQLGNLQTTGVGFDTRNYDSTQQAQCLYLLGVGENPDPATVTLGDLAGCSAGGN